MSGRGLLTPDERRVLRGEKDIEDRANRLSTIRYNFRQRMDELEEDLEILEEAGEDDLVDEFFQRFEKVSQIESEQEEVKETLEKLQEDVAELQERLGEE